MGECACGEEFFSPAKVNLFLHLVGKRSDGYHELVSLMQALDFGDLLSISPSNVDELQCNDPEVPLDRSNLIWKAADLFWDAVSFKKHISFKLTKKIPIGAGLGGGSSNAATTLFGLNKIFGNPLSSDKLLELAGKVGSDVAFFLSSGAALCFGRGERFEDISIKSREIWLSIPDFSVSTREVYGLSTPDDFKKRDLEAIVSKYKNGELPLFNDLEPLALKLEPRLQKIKNNLSYSSMTGSGSAFICLSEPRIDCNFVKTKFINRAGDRWYEKKV